MSLNSKKSEMSSKAAALVDGVGDFIEYWGFKKIHGKIWTLIFLAEKPVDANYLINHLGVSKALVSMSIKDLLHYNVILESPEKRSTLHYVSNPKMVDVIFEVLMAREAKMLLKIKKACESLARVDGNKLSTEVSPERLKKLGQMVAVADKTLKTFVTLRQLSFKDIGKTFNLN